jgi:NAD(P)-dependent dehydrogenase (short-subunit alcohol dehydrogenase family)
MTSNNAPVWFITGTASGLGHALALELVARKQRVIATARDSSKIADLEKAGASVVACNISDPLEALVAVAKQAHDIHGRVDYLINNAGFAQQGTVEELTTEEIAFQYATNVFGTINVIKAFLPYLRAQRSGVIANVSSLGAWRGTPGFGIYESSKWAVSGLSETLRLELKEFGIEVCSIEPGSFRSRFLNPASRKSGGLEQDTRIADYEGTAARKVGEALASKDGKQPGDLKKAAKAIFEVLSKADGEEIPLRLVLGKDSYEQIKGKCESTLQLLEKWKDVSTGTDHDDVA